jgi:hypothetical protein
MRAKFDLVSLAQASLEASSEGGGGRPFDPKAFSRALSKGRTHRQVDLTFVAESPDDEIKMAIHFAHDAAKPEHIARVKRQDITRHRAGGVQFKAPRWTAGDEIERGPFPADAFALGSVDAWVTALVAGGLTQTDALDVLNPRNLQIRHKLWRAARKGLKFRRQTARRSADPVKRLDERDRLRADRAANPDKEKIRNKKAAADDKLARAALRAECDVRGGLEFVAIDSEGFDTLRYFAEDPPDLRNPLSPDFDPLDVPVSQAGEHDLAWYLKAHGLPPDANPDTRVGYRRTGNASRSFLCLGSSVG